MFVYQMLIGDATDEYFLEYNARTASADGEPGSLTPYILYALYLISSFLLSLIMLNIIIAIMGNTNAVRTGMGRKVIYKNQLETVINRIFKFKHEISVTDWTDRALGTGKFKNRCCNWNGPTVS